MATWFVHGDVPFPMKKLRTEFLFYSAFCFCIMAMEALLYVSVALKSCLKIFELFSKYHDHLDNISL